jgi:RimJ/RimL family protein N-acetyltransferase
VCAACQDPEIQRWLPLLPRPYTLDHARAFVAVPDGPYSFAIEEDGRLAGSIALRVDAQSASGNVGYWCAPEARGRGVTTRALRLLCEYGLGELGLERLELVAHVDNAASLRVAEKAGFRREGRRGDDVMLALTP